MSAATFRPGDRVRVLANGDVSTVEHVGLPNPPAPGLVLVYVRIRHVMHAFFAEELEHAEPAAPALPAPSSFAGLAALRHGTGVRIR